MYKYFVLLALLAQVALCYATYGFDTFNPYTPSKGESGFEGLRVRWSRHNDLLFVKIEGEATFQSYMEIPDCFVLLGRPGDKNEVLHRVVLSLDFTWEVTDNELQYRVEEFAFMEFTFWKDGTCGWRGQDSPPRKTFLREPQDAEGYFVGHPRFKVEPTFKDFVFL